MQKENTMTRNQTFWLALIFGCISGTAFAQAQVQRSSNPQGIQIQGNAEFKSDQGNVSAMAKGEANTAKNTAGAIKGEAQIQGNTRITTSQKNTNAKAEGKNSKASNEAGVIGGN
jgi:hypothetical protein